MRSLLLVLVLLFGALASPVIADPAGDEPASWDNLTRQAVEETIAWVREAKGFAQEQAPLVVAELIRRDTVRAIVGTLFFAALVVFSADQARRGYRFGKGENDFDSFMSTGRLLLGTVGGILFCAVAAANVDWFLTVALAPRLYVLEQLAELMK